MIDVSPYQGLVVWEKVKAAGHTHAYIKASEGLTLPENAWWLTNTVKRARDAGVQVGLYHYAHPSNAPHREAAHFLEVAGSHLLPGDIRPALDLEVSEGHSWEYLNDWKAQWLAVVDQHVRSLAVFYSYWYFVKQMRLYASRPVWGAYVGGKLPAGTDWTMWQYSFTGEVDGISGHVDLDRIVKAVPTIPTPPIRGGKL